MSDVTTVLVVFVLALVWLTLPFRLSNEEQRHVQELGSQRTATLPPEDIWIDAPTNKKRRLRGLPDASEPVVATDVLSTLLGHSFDLEHAYTSDNGAVKDHSKRRRREVTQVLETAVNSARRQHWPLNYEDLEEGVSIHDFSKGTQYELTFWDKTHQHRIKVSMLRPYAPLSLHAIQVDSRSNVTINIVVPLMGRTDAFRSFLARLLELADPHVRLSVACFGNATARYVRRALVQHQVQARYVVLTEPFSRARGLVAGAALWPSLEDPVLLLCDVDMLLSRPFLSRCRWNAQPGRKAYFPVVFSQYNPQHLQRLGHQPPLDGRSIRIHKDLGYWRTAGYGILCTHLSDFSRMRSASFLQRDGWGGEDVVLYRDYLRDPQLRVLRALDPGLQHLWHPKSCAEPGFSPLQLRACLKTRLRNEAAADNLAILRLP